MGGGYLGDVLGVSGGVWGYLGGLWGVSGGAWGRGEREWLLDFGNGNGNCSTHSQILGTGTGMKNSIPNFWEWERE